MRLDQLIRVTLGLQEFRIDSVVKVLFELLVTIEPDLRYLWCPFLTAYVTSRRITDKREVYPDQE